MNNNLKNQMKNLAEYSDTPLLSQWVPKIIPILENILISDSLEEEDKEVLQIAINYFKLHHI